MVNISGTLTADDTRDIHFTADGIMIMMGGLLEVGTESQPFQHKFVFTINGADPGFQTARTMHRSDNALTGNTAMPAMRGLMVMAGGSLSLVGAVPQRTKTKLNQHANAGDFHLTLADTVDWKKGDHIAISTTDYYGYGETEVLELDRDTLGSPNLHLTSPLVSGRWGRLQYATSSGMSLVDDGTAPLPNEDVPSFLDERAEVIHLTRNILIQAPDDALWNNGGDDTGNNSGAGFGVHTMIMRGALVARANGVEFRRCGQAQRLERYGWHWHVMSYSGTGPGSWQSDLNPVDHHVKNCTFYDSANRAVNIHGTCGVEVDETYAVKIRGHAFFLEDGSEERNTITDCVAMDVRNPAGKVLIPGRNYGVDGGSYQGSNNQISRSNDRCIKLHDQKASGFWITNPLNRVERNWASECAGAGIWNSFADQVFGLTAGVYNSADNPIVPRKHHYNGFNDNVGHGCLRNGIRTHGPVIDDAGRTGSAYMEHDVAPDGVSANESPMRLSRNSIWKNNDNGYFNRVRNPEYVAWTCADNHGIDFTGATRTGAKPSELRDSLMIGESLNNENHFPSYKIPPFTQTRRPRRGAASYHFSLIARDCLIVNYPLRVQSATNQPYVDGRHEMLGGGGFISGADNYLDPFTSYYFMPGLQLVNSSAGYVSPPPYFNGYPLRGPYARSPSGSGSDSDWMPRDYLHFSLTTAVEDFWGYWGPERSYIITNEPFFTHDMSASAVPVDASHGPANLRDWDGFVEGDGAMAPTPLAQGTAGKPYAYSTPDRMFGIGAIRPRLIQSGTSQGQYPTPWSGSDHELVMRLDRLDTLTRQPVDEYIIGLGKSGKFDFLTSSYFTTTYPGATGNPANPKKNFLKTTFGFRHFGAMQGGYYKITFPGDPNASDTRLVQGEPKLGPADVVFSLVTENLFRHPLQGDAELDWIILCVPWSGTVVPHGRYEMGNFSSLSNSRIMHASGLSITDVENSADGSVMWHDTANNELWFKLVGGLTPAPGWITPTQRRALTEVDVANTSYEEYKRRALFQVRATAW